MAYDASLFPVTQARLATIMYGDNATKAERKFPTPILLAMTANQRVNMEPLAKDGKCVSVDAWFYEVGQHLTVANPADKGCTLTPGQTGQTRKKNFKTRVLATAAFTITGPKCDNALMLAEETAVNLAKGMSDIRKDVQKGYYDLFTDNAQADQWGENPIFEVSAAGGNRLAVDPEKWDFELQRDMHALAINNDFPDNVMYVHGNNLWSDKDLAEYRKNNDNQRDQAAIFDDALAFWDMRSLDSYLGSKSSFIVNPDNFIFHNVAYFEETATVQDTSKNYVRARIADPVWEWNDNGTMRPVEYHWESEKVCIGTNELNERIYQVVQNLTLLGIQDIGPAGFNNPVDTAVAPTLSITGVIEIRKEAVA